MADDRQTCIIAMLMENQPGALSRVVGLFSQRGYNIECLNVAPTDDVTLSRLTLKTVVSPQIALQIKKHINRLVDVVSVYMLSPDASVVRELILLKIDRQRISQAELEEHLRPLHGGQIIDIQDEVYIVQLSGEPALLNQFLQAMRRNITEMVRSGVLGISNDIRVLG